MYFSSDRISWECGFKKTLTEYLPFDLRGRGFDVNFVAQYNIREDGTLWHFYEELVDEYMSRELTFPVTDKLVAFAAIARRCARWFRGDYCAGIFRDTMPWGLLWQAGIPGDRTTSETCQAPSWSWASMDCRIRGDFIPMDQKTDLAEVVDVSVELVDPNNQFGQVKSGSLTLTGPLVSVNALIFSDCQTSQRGPSPMVGRENSTSALGHHFEVKPDDMVWDNSSVNAWLSKQQDMFLLAIGESQWIRSEGEGPKTCGVVLKRLEDGNYVRTGQWDGGFGFVDNHAETPCEFHTETVTIV